MPRPTPAPPFSRADRLRVYGRRTPLPAAALFARARVNMYTLFALVYVYYTHTHTRTHNNTPVRGARTRRKHHGVFTRTRRVYYNSVRARGAADVIYRN